MTPGVTAATFGGPDPFMLGFILQYANDMGWKMDVHMDECEFFATAIRWSYDFLAHTIIGMTSRAVWDANKRIRELLSCANIVLPCTLQLVFTKFGYVVPTNDIIARDVADLANLDNILLLIAFAEDSQDPHGPYAQRLRQIYDPHRPIEEAAFCAVNQAARAALPRIRGQPPPQIPAMIVEAIVAHILPENWEALSRFVHPEHGRGPCQSRAPVRAPEFGVMPR
jgi:hypothetical protein